MWLVNAQMKVQKNGMKIVPHAVLTPKLKPRLYLPAKYSSLWGTSHPIATTWKLPSLSAETTAAGDTFERIFWE